MSDASDKASPLVRGMQESILAFERGGIGIDRLTWDLKSRISALRSVTNDAWADELKSIWNQLEVVNAFFIDSGRRTLSANEETEVREILDELSAAIARYLHPTPRHGRADSRERLHKRT